MQPFSSCSWISFPLLSYYQQLYHLFQKHFHIVDLSPQKVNTTKGIKKAPPENPETPQYTRNYYGNLNLLLLSRHYIIPGMPPIAGAAVAAPSGAGLSATRVSVVRTIAAMLAAFCRAERVTLAGSTIPASIMLT